MFKTELATTKAALSDVTEKHAAASEELRGSKEAVQNLTTEKAKVDAELATTKAALSDVTEKHAKKKNQIILIEGSHTLTSDHDTHPSR